MRAPGRAGAGHEDRAAEFGLMLQNLAAVKSNYLRAGIRFFVLAYFVRSTGEVQGVREALGLPLRVVRLTTRLPSSSGGWRATLRAAGVTTCARRQRRSRPGRVLAWRT